MTRLAILRGFALPRLAKAYQYTGDEKYARKALVILHRLAEVYPQLPLWSMGTIKYESQAEAVNTQKGLSLGTDKTPLTQKEFAAWKRPSRFQFPPWGPGTRMGMGKMIAYWLSGSASSYLIVKESNSLEALSQEVFQDKMKLGQMIQNDYFKQMADEISGMPLWLGNYASKTMKIAVSVGIAAQDQALYNLGMQVADDLILNYFGHDAVISQASINYIGMMSGYSGNLKNMLGTASDARDRAFPFNRFVRENKNFPFEVMSTFRGVRSGHGDGNDRRLVPGKYDPKDNLLPQSRFCPDYGFATLASGQPGHRLEGMILFDRHRSHAHLGNLNLQLGFEGMLVMPELGYCSWWRSLDLSPKNPKAKATLDLPWRYRLMPDMKPKTGWNKVLEYPNVCSLSHTGALQNIVLMNERPGRITWNAETGFGSARTLAAPNKPGKTGRLLQVVEVEDNRSMRRTGVACSLYRRAVMTIECENGRSYVVDVFRTRGGQRHCYQLKFPLAEVTQHSLGEGKSVGNGQNYLDTKPGVKEWKIQEGLWSANRVDHGFSFLNKMQVFPAKDSYTIQWLWNPDLQKGAKRPQGHPNMKFALHSLRPPLGRKSYQDGSKEEVWLSRAHYPRQLQVKVEGRLQRGAVAFENGMGVYSKFRSGKTHLMSRFTHVFDLYPEGTAATVKSIQPQTIPHSVFPPSLHDNYGVGLWVQVMDGSKDLIVSTPDAEERTIPIQNPDPRGRSLVYKPRARFSLLRLDNEHSLSAVSFVNGSGFSYGSLQVDSGGDHSGQIVDIIGDITGTRTESALLVRPHKPWPLGTVLAGENLMIAVGTDHEDIYSIEKISAAGEFIRIDFKGVPPLGYVWNRVREVKPERPASFTCVFRSFVKGAQNTYFNNKRLYFPTLNLHLRVKELPLMRRDFETITVLADPEVNLADLGVRPGMPFVIYGLAPGQAVRVPSRFSLKQTQEGKFMVQSNLDFSIRYKEEKKEIASKQHQGKEITIEF